MPRRFSHSLLLLALLCSGRAGAQSEAELEAKARAFRDAIVDRHLAPEGIVLYRVNLGTVREDLRRGTYPELADAPTHTGLFAAASCSQLSVQPDSSDARADAAAALGGLTLLMEVTGQPGLLARSLRRDDGRDLAGLRGKWLPAAAPHERYVFRSDVSVDQYANGMLPAAAACSPFFPERSRALTVAFASHLLEHDMQLIQLDGTRTRFGDLSWRSGMGFNSIYQLTGYAAFALAAQLDDDPRWPRARDRARDHYRVPARSRITNLRIGATTSHSNDLMAFNLYRVLIPIARERDDPALADLRHGLHRTWLRVRADGNAYFVAVLCYVEPESCDREALAEARSLLARFPLDKRKLAVHPALDDLPRRWLPGRKGRTLAAQPVPIELRPASSLEWKSSPYRLAGADLPDVEYTGVDYLLAYWMLRRVEARIGSLAAAE